LRQPLVHDAVHLHFLAVGLLFWWPLVGLDPSRWRLPHIARVGFVFLMVPFHAFLGVAIMNSGRVLAPTLESFQRTWGPTPLADQQVGGAILWGAGDLITIGAVLGVLISWASYEEKVVAVREDRRLARERAAGRAPPPPPPPPPPPAPPPPTHRPPPPGPMSPPTNRGTPSGSPGPPRDLTGRVRAWWDADAATYDHSPDHGPGPPAQQAAWYAARYRLVAAPG